MRLKGERRKSRREGHIGRCELGARSEWDEAVTALPGRNLVF